MKIAVVHSFYSSSQPSGENVVVGVQLDQLARSGHDVVLLSRSTDQASFRKTYKAAVAWRTVSGRDNEIALDLQKIRPDVIHLHNTFPNFGTRWLREWGERTVSTIHNYRTVCAASTLFRSGQPCHACLVRPVLPAVRYGCYHGSRVQSLPVAIAAAPGGALRNVLTMSTHLVALNHEMRETLRKVTPTPITVVPNFVDAQDLGTGVTAKWAFVGRLTEEKGILRLLDAWDSSNHLHIFGSGPLEGRVREASARNASITFHGHVERSALLHQLATMEGLVVPSLWPEGLPTVILEALAHGVPLVLSTAISSSQSLVRDGVAIELEMDDLVASLQKAVTAVRRRGNVMRIHVQDYQRAHYSPHVWTSSIDNIYQTIASR